MSKTLLFAIDTNTKEVIVSNSSKGSNEVNAVELCSATPFDYHIDGELFRTTESEKGMFSVHIQVIPNQLTFLVPGTFYRKFHPFLM